MASRVTINVEAGSLGADVIAGARLLRQIAADDLRRELGPQLVGFHRSVAPRKTGRLVRGIQSTTSIQGTRPMVEVESTATSDEGYSYTSVTRFGHRSARIYPRTAKALRFTIAGRVIFAASVRGHHPAHDWVDDAYPAAENAVEAAGRRIVTRLEERIG